MQGLTLVLAYCFMMLVLYRFTPVLYSTLTHTLKSSIIPGLMASLAFLPHHWHNLLCLFVLALASFDLWKAIQLYLTRLAMNPGWLL